NTEGYNNISESGFTKVSTNRYSTFGADVDTATCHSLMIRATKTPRNLQP
ncbi:MAG: von Willebrand factor type A domain-containing protein, partial [Lachnospiraceae bacterium]|nr:von Willebrand factor type A domain-containing protein [Lachnospiraceae bacterium]